MFGTLDRGTACDALIRAIAKNRKYRGKKTEYELAKVHDKCMAYWKKPTKRKANPKTSGCPVRTVTIQRKSGKVVKTFKARVCSKTEKRARRSPRKRAR